MWCEQCGKNKNEEPMFFKFDNKDGTKIERTVCRKCYWDLMDKAITIRNLDALIEKSNEKIRELNRNG